MHILLLLCSTSWAQEAAQKLAEPQNLEQAVALLPVIQMFIKSGQWLMAGVASSLLLTYVAKQYVLPKIQAGNYWLPLISVGIGALSGVGGAIAAGATPVAAVLALLSGPLASTIWDVVFKAKKKPLMEPAPETPKSPAIF